MEQIEKLGKLINMEPVLVIIIGVGIILIIFGLGAFVSARRRKRIARSREKVLKKGEGIELIVSSCSRISEPFTAVLRACSGLPGGEAFLKTDEVASALRELESSLGVKKEVPAPKKKKGKGELSLLDYSSRPAVPADGTEAKKSMVRIIRAIYMDRELLKALKEGYSGELKEAVESLTE